MGIPGLARTIEDSNNYKKFKTVIYKLEEDIDHFFLDFNGIVYTIEAYIRNKYMNNKTNYEKLLIKEILKHTREIICKVVKPNKTVYIAFDGPVPRAKISEQRKRRFKSILENKLKNEIKKKHNEPIKDSWNTSANMFPGTVFMTKLQKEFKRVIKEKYFCKHKDIKVIFSSGNVPGEGEHKLLPTIRKLKKSKKTRDDKICLFSPDGDLIVLLLISNKNNVYLMDYYKDKTTKKKEINKFKYTSIDNYRKALKNFIRVKMDVKQFSIDYNLLMCFLGNDFVRNFIITSSKQTNISLDKIIFPKYEGIYNKIKKPLQKLTKDNIIINHKFLREILKSIGLNEDFRYKKYYEFNIEKAMLGKLRNRRRNKGNEEKTEYEKDMEIFMYSKICDPKHKFLYKDYIGEFTKINYSLPYKVWKQQYYKYYFDLDITKSNSREKLVSIVHDYLKSLLFVQKYYFLNVPSWSWYYKYETTPLPSDIADIMGKEIPDINKITFDDSKPYTPLQQMMFVMPIQLVNQFPQSSKFKKIMISKKYKHLYPKNYRLFVTLGLKFEYAVVELPNYDDSILNEVKKIEDNLSDKTKKRNILTNKLYKKDCLKIK